MAPNNNNKRNNKKKRNKDKKKMASGAGVVVVGGIDGNNNHNTIPIPIVATASTTTVAMTLVDEYLEEFGLKDYPKSTYSALGMNHFTADQEDLAMAAFIRGAKNDGCVVCMHFYVYFLNIRKPNSVHLVLPWALECSIRGHPGCIMQLITTYNLAKPALPRSLRSIWVKMAIELGDNTITEETRKNSKKHIANVCIVCRKEDSKDKTFEKCCICKYYSYCGKDCQTYGGNHIAECRHLKILREYCKPRYVKEIRDAIIGGVDPKDIPRLQNLRTALGLNRPKEEYEELLLRLGDDSNMQDRYNYLTARKDGTVHIGSTPEAI